MDARDDKINTHFSGLVVRKDLVKAVKGNAIVPSYVLEYLLGQYCATSDAATIQTGIETVKEILRKHYVHRNEAGLIRSNIKEKGRYKVIDTISVALNDRAGVYEAEFSNLGIKKVLVDSGTVKAHPKLLVSAVWCIADVEYEFTEDKNASPWILSSLKPIQLSQFDFDQYVQARRQFTTDEWIDLLVQSIGFNPDMFGKRSKLLQLTRLVPFCERNYNLIELGPKGTGKSHIYSEFSPHGMLISGGEVTVPKLFVNNSSGKIGLVGYWDCVAFDEFAGKQKRVDKALVDIMKNYMANKSFSRGVETLGAEASMVFVGNTQHTVAHMLKHSDLFCELPEKFHDSAFLDRLHFYIPGWEVDIIRGEMFSSGYGFVVDYLAEILRSLRSHDYSDRYKAHFALSPDLSTRDRDGIHKTFSGLMKIVYPHGEASSEEIEELLQFAMEGRKRVKDQLMRLDSTYSTVQFSYHKIANGQTDWVTTREEDEHTNVYGQAHVEQPAIDTTELQPSTQAVESGIDSKSAGLELQPQQIYVKENQKGISFDQLFGAYLHGATVVTVCDPNVRLASQIRHMMEFLETVVRQKGIDEEVSVHLITQEDEFNSEQQTQYLEAIRTGASSLGVTFSWAFESDFATQAAQVTINNGWQVVLSRGLDLFQPYDMTDMLSFSNRVQQSRPCKACEISLKCVDREF